MKAFRTPKTTLGDLDAEAAAALIAAAADIALILDEAGVIRDVSIAAQDLADGPRRACAVAGQALGRHRHRRKPPEGRGADCRRGLEARNRAGGTSTIRRRRGPDVPILYAAVRAGTPNRIVAFGRDLRAVSSLQRRLVDAQQSMERDYARIRHVETRYRLLFQMASDAVLIVDGSNLRVLDSNPDGAPAVRRTGGAGADLAHGSRVFTDETARVGRSVACRCRRRRAAPDDVHARLAEGDREVVVSASLFRDESRAACLLRIAAPQTDPAGTVVPKIKSKLLKLMESAPDAFVVTGDDGRVITANAAFLELAQLPTEEQARGESLERWLGRSSIDLDILLANLRHHGSVRLFAHD